MNGAAGSNPPVLSFVELFFYLLPFQLEKFGLRNPGYPQIPKRFFTKNRCASKIRNRALPPSREKNCVLTGAVGSRCRLLSVGWLSILQHTYICSAIGQ